MADYTITHTTTYNYHYPVSVSYHVVHLEPMRLSYQQCRQFELITDPGHQDYRQRVDYFGNTIGLFSIQEEHQKLHITSKSEVSVHLQAPDINAFPITCAEASAYFETPAAPLDTIQYLFGSNRIPQDPDDAIRSYAKKIFTPNKPLLQACADLMQDIKTRFAFDAKATTINTSVEDFFKLKRGVCQDFSHFAITALNAMALPARYVSGYILTNPPPGKPRLEGADASHAWVSVYVPEHGWVDFDPTNNIFCADQHVTVAYGRDFDDVSLVRGAVTGGRSHDLKVAVTMKPTAEAISG